MSKPEQPGGDGVEAPSLGVRKTVLHDLHVAAGGRMVEFAGWSMPLHYSAGVLAEHRAVRESAGVFDVSHMGEFRIAGPGASAFLQRLTLNDLSKLKPGRAQYTMLPNAAGGTVDDAYLYGWADTDYLLVVNASNTAKAAAHLRAHLPANGSVWFADETERWALLAVQGPRAEAALGPLCEAELTGARKNSVIHTRLLGRPATLARTGYTGEDGFEIFLEAGDAPALWMALERAGLTPAGLGARDTLRLEAGFPLYGHELDENTSALHIGFDWVVKFEKGDFIGRPALEALRRQGLDRRLVGLRLLERGVPRQGCEVRSRGAPAGAVTSGTLSPSLGYGIAMAFVRPELAAIGTPLGVVVRDRVLSAEVTAMPFLKRDDS